MSIVAATSGPLRSLIRLVANLLVALALARHASAQLPSPRLTAIFPPGGQAGATVDVTLSSGADLDEAGQLLFSHPGITATQKTADPAPYQSGPQPVAGQFQVAIAPDVPPGVYEARAVGVFGLSTPRAFVVGDHPELNEAEPNNEPSQAQPLPINAVVNGTADGEPSDFYRFEGRAGQTLVIDCWAYRIDSRMDATLVLSNASGQELARSRDEQGLDPRVVFRVPADGVYLMRVFDYTFQGGADYFYRLSARNAPHVEMVFPLAGPPGTTPAFTLFGYNLPGGVAGANPRTGAEVLERVAVEIPVPALDDVTGPREQGGFVDSRTSTVDQFVYRHASPRGVSNPVRIGLATAPVVEESLDSNDTRDAAQVIPLPAEVSGQFYPARDVDWYAFEAKAGQTYWIEVIAARLGQNVDADLMIEGGGARTADGGQRPGRGNRRGRRRQAPEVVQGEGVQVFDDTQPEVGGPAFRTASSDPIVAWTAPKDGLHRLSVRDLFSAGQGDPRTVYRLSIHPAQPDFRLVALLRQPAKDDQQINPWALTLRRGGCDSVRVIALRRDGFDGPIQLTVEGLPPGVTCPPITIAAGETSAWIPFTAAEDAAPFAGEFRIVGRAHIGEQDVAHVAQGGDVLFPGAQNQQALARPRVTSRTVLAVLSETLPFSVAANAGQVWETAKNGKLEIPVTVTRRGEFKGNVVIRPQQLPRETQLAEIIIPGDQSAGTLTLAFNANTPVGEFTIPLQSETTISYRRNPAAAARAEVEKQAAEKLAAEAAAAVAALDGTRQQMESKLAEAQALLTQTQQALAAADQALAAANEVDKPAAQTARDGAQNAVDAATKSVTEATASRDAAAQAVAAATETSKAAEQMKQSATQRATDAAKAAEPKDIAVLASAGAVTIRVAAAPLTLSPTPPSDPLRPGQSLEVPIQLARRYGFADQVAIEASLPDAPAGVTVESLTLPADQSDAKLKLTAAAEPAAGEHRLLLRAKFKFNEQDMQVEETIRFRVETVAP